MNIALVVAICFCAYFVDSSTDLQPYFRNDYKYVDKEEAFYKVHVQPRSWHNARAICDAEGASLLYPETHSEAVLMNTLLRESTPNSGGMWVGAHDILAEGTFVKLNGEDLSSYAPWGSGEPNDAAMNEDCVMLNNGGTLNDQRCEALMPAICKKTLKTVVLNPYCGNADPAYVPNSDKTSCYKLHTIPKTWTKAFTICHAEQSHLAVINSNEEADFLVNLLKRISDSKIKGQYHKFHIGIGFHDLLEEGDYMTVLGDRLVDSGYTVWQNNMPDNYNGNEHCGSITHNGELNDINCNNTRMLFICEREIKHTASNENSTTQYPSQQYTTHRSV